MVRRSARYASNRTELSTLAGVAASLLAGGRARAVRLAAPERGRMSARLSSVFPRPAASDPDDVVWTLQTAAVQWQRGLRADAIVWVRKAADLSIGGGRSDRAEELRNQAARLAEYLWTDPEEP